jgi:hypothetical protein
MTGFLSLPLSVRGFSQEDWPVLRPKSNQPWNEVNNGSNLSLFQAMERDPKMEIATKLPLAVAKGLRPERRFFWRHHFASLLTALLRLVLFA